MNANLIHLNTTLLLLISLALAPLGRTAIVPNDAVVEGKTLAEWSADWWIWVNGIPCVTNPLLDCDGSRATNWQSGPVFFMVGVGGGVECSHTVRTFNVPADKYIFFPLVNANFGCIDQDASCSAEDVYDALADWVSAITELHASIDGVPVTNCWDYRLISPIFSTTFPESNWWQCAGYEFVGTLNPAASDGYWLMLEPLSPGPHVINFGGGNWIDITNFITVLPVNHPPVTDASATRSPVISPNNRNACVVLDGSRSSDADHDPLNYAWWENGTLLARGVTASCVLAVGTHTITLAVEDGAATNTTTITVAVITASQAVEGLVGQVAGAALPAKVEALLLTALRQAQAALVRDYAQAGVQHLHQFQQQVRNHLAKSQPALSAILIQQAQVIRDAVARN